jgi:hypothetical protein
LTGSSASNTAYCRWKRFKKNTSLGNPSPKKAANANGRKKGSTEDKMQVDGDDKGESKEEHNEEKRPAKKAKRQGRPRKIKTEAIEEKGDEEDVGGKNEEDEEDDYA